MEYIWLKIKLFSLSNIFSVEINKKNCSSLQTCLQQGRKRWKPCLQHLKVRYWRTQYWELVAAQYQSHVESLIVKMFSGIDTSLILSERTNFSMKKKFKTYSTQQTIMVSIEFLVIVKFTFSYWWLESYSVMISNRFNIQSIFILLYIIYKFCYLEFGFFLNISNQCVAICLFNQALFNYEIIL